MIMNFLITFMTVELIPEHNHSWTFSMKQVKIKTSSIDVIWSFLRVLCCGDTDSRQIEQNCIYNKWFFMLHLPSLLSSICVHIHFTYILHYIYVHNKFIIIELHLTNSTRCKVELVIRLNRNQIVLLTFYKIKWKSFHVYSGKFHSCSKFWSWYGVSYMVS